MYTLIGIIWLALSIIIAIKWYNKTEKNIIRMGSPKKAFDILSLGLGSLSDRFGYSCSGSAGILLGILNVWGWIIGLVCIAGIVIWMLVKRKH